MIRIKGMYEVKKAPSEFFLMDYSVYNHEETADFNSNSSINLLTRISIPYILDNFNEDVFPNSAVDIRALALGNYYPFVFDKYLNADVRTSILMKAEDVFDKIYPIRIKGRDFYIGYKEYKYNNPLHVIVDKNTGLIVDVLSKEIGWKKERISKNDDVKTLANYLLRKSRTFIPINYVAVEHILKQVEKNIETVKGKSKPFIDFTAHLSDFNVELNKLKSKDVLSPAELSEREMSFRLTPEDLFTLISDITKQFTVLPVDMKKTDMSFLYDVLAGAWMPVKNQYLKGKHDPYMVALSYFVSTVCSASKQFVVYKGIDVSLTLFILYFLSVEGYQEEYKEYYKRVINRGLLNLSHNDAVYIPFLNNSRGIIIPINIDLSASKVVRKYGIQLRYIPSTVSYKHSRKEVFVFLYDIPIFLFSLPSSSVRVETLGEILKPVLYNSPKLLKDFMKTNYNFVEVEQNEGI